MTNITQNVWGFLNKNPQIGNCLALDIINVRGLAQFIIHKENIETTPHAVISAIRRYKKDLHMDNTEQRVADLLRTSKISTKSRLVSISISRDFSFLARLIPEILARIDVNKAELLRLIEGRTSMKMVIDQKKKDEILSLIPRERLYGINESLAEINILFDESKQDAPGLFSVLMNQLASHGINVVNLFGGMPELLILVKEKDLAKTHDLMLEYFYGDEIEH